MGLLAQKLSITEMAVPSNVFGSKFPRKCRKENASRNPVLINFFSFQQFFLTFTTGQFLTAFLRKFRTQQI